MGLVAEMMDTEPAMAGFAEEQSPMAPGLGLKSPRTAISRRELKRIAQNMESDAKRLRAISEIVV